MSISWTLLERSGDHRNRRRMSAADRENTLGVPTAIEILKKLKMDAAKNIIKKIQFQNSELSKICVGELQDNAGQTGCLKAVFSFNS